MIAWPNPQMWRRYQNNAAMPVPTFHPDDGSDSHVHSPRRKSHMGRGTGGSGVPIANMSGALNIPTAAAINYNPFPQGVPAYQKTSGTSSSSGYVDPFGDVAYQEWVNAMGMAHQQQGPAEQRTVWPGAVARNSNMQSGHNVGMSAMPDYLASTMDQAMGSDQMGMSSFTMDDDGSGSNLKVPTNTPIGTADGSACAAGSLCSLGPRSWTALTKLPKSGQFGYDFPTPTISGELAQSLTHSLLSQPHPIHGVPQFAQPHQIPLPASEVRSRKENRHLNNASADSPSATASPSVEAQIRKFSHTSNAFGVIGQDRDSSGLTTSRRTSGGDFGLNITNHATPSQTYAGVTAFGTAPSSGSEKSNKRNRTFTPASAQAVDDDDEPRRLSPRMRMASSVPDDDEVLASAEE